MKVGLIPHTAIILHDIVVKGRDFDIGGVCGTLASR